MRVKKYVLGVNIWFSYFINQQELQLASVILENELTIFYCDELIEEITRVSNYKRIQKYHIEAIRVVQFIKMSSIHFTLTYPIRNYVPSDENDNYIVALALQTNSGFLTSGDSHILSQKHLLEKRYTKLKIITKSAFEERFSSQNFG